MTIDELSMEIRVGDIIDGKYIVESLSCCYAYSGKLKFRIRQHVNAKDIKRIQTVARNGKIYYRLQPRGGAHNLHTKGGRWA